MIWYLRGNKNAQRVIHKNIPFKISVVIVEDYYLSHSMELVDAIIAATALENNEVLLTGNDKHYGFIPNIETRKFRH